MKDLIDKVVSDETWMPMDERSQVLSRSTDLFLYIKRILKRCSSYTRGEKLLDLQRVFNKHLTSYATALDTRLSRHHSTNPVTGLSVGSTLPDAERQVTCLVINTAEYCCETVRQLAASIGRLVNESLAEEIDASGVEDVFHQ